MTGLKLVFLAAGAIGGIASTITGGIVATTQTGGAAISSDTPVALTFGLVASGVVGTAVAAWKASRVWAGMEADLKTLREKVESLERSRAAELREKLARKTPNA